MLEKILVSRYRLIETITQGGFGTTFLAEDMHLPGTPPCVVKQLTIEQNNSSILGIARRLFNQEAITLQKLGKHPQIPQLFAFFEENNDFFLVQEFIKGISLEEEFERKQRLSELETIDLLRDCLGILAFVHDLGVIHRDIKPANLMRRQSDGKLILLDFGAVKEIRVDHNPIADTTVSIGTPGYMPDEQLRGKPRFASDIYALGLTGLQGLTNVHPHTLGRNEYDEITWQHLVSIRPEMAKILSKMVRRDPRHRYAQAKEILADMHYHFGASMAAGPQIRLTAEAPTQLFIQEVEAHALTEKRSKVGPSSAEGPSTYKQPEARYRDTLSATPLENLSQPIGQNVPTSNLHFSNPDISTSEPQPISTSELANMTSQSLPAVEPGLQISQLSSQKHKASEAQMAAQRSPAAPSINRAVSSLNPPQQGANPSSLNSTRQGTKMSQRQPLKFIKVLIPSTLLVLAGTGAYLLWLRRPSATDKVIDQLELLNQQEKYTHCIQTGEAASANPDIPESSIREPLILCYLGAAQDKASQKQYIDALKIISKVPASSAKYKEAQQKINAWSTQILSQARIIYADKGQLQEALAHINAIPKSSNVRAEATELASQWQEQHKTNEKLIQDAQVALNKGQPEDALAKAEAVRQPKFWKLKADKIIKAAREKIASRPIVPTSPAPAIRPTPAPAPVIQADPAPVPVPQPAPTSAPAPKAQPASTPAPTKVQIICPGHPLCVE